MSHGSSLMETQLTFKPCFLQICLVLADLTCSRDTANVQSDAFLHVFTERLSCEDVTDGDSSSRLEQSVHLIECELLLRFRNKIDDTIADDTVGSLV